MLAADRIQHFLAAIVPNQASPTPEPNPGEVMPLVGYSPFWLVLGIAILALIAAFYVLVLLFTAGRTKPTKMKAKTEPPVDLEKLQHEGYSKIAQIETASMNGTLDPKAAHEQLSAVVREYVAEATGIPADHMTLSDLRRTELRGTTRAVEQFYPAVFGAEPQQDLGKSIHMAREVLAGWR
ncbi:hypothetical protein [Gulosibacter molinativorax]|uniref:DUF4129 domain-containing protein n=1 Tax=Gulosibacter molinativorax TaxID=256821 RepID=A0ABT7C3L8_9MICO|nr:hypothetical protein [Gulosibacter molinativorax]MDJ1369858.1 hypothetical protein [Gulosibacter molinativorax]QUY61823.1 Hypotetical protein [Gulosibacter molinativorax]